MSLKAEKIHSNYEKHLKIVDHYITDRKDKCKKLIEHLGEAYIMAPASGKSWHHNAFPGGYVDHVNRVVEFSLKQMKLYKEMGGTIDFTEEELVFAEEKVWSPGIAAMQKETNTDKVYITSNGEFKLPGRSVMLIRNVGHLMTNPAILLKNGEEIPEGIMDAMITSLLSLIHI